MRKSFLLAATLLFSVYSCKKDQSVISEVTLDDVTVPDGFNWQTTREVNFSVGISDSRFQDAMHLISIYDGDPERGGSLISQGAASLVSSFNSKISLPSVIKQVYIVKTAPDGTLVTEKVDVGGADISLSIGAQSVTKTMSSVSGKQMSLSSPAATSSAVDCTSGCTKTITVSENNINVNDNEVICITGNNITVGINSNGGTVRICGSNVKISGANLNNSSKLLVSSGATVIFDHFNMNGSLSYFENNGTVTFNGTFSPGGTVINNGPMTVSGDFNLNNGSSFTNNSVLNIASAMNVSTSTVSLNSGKITTSEDFKLNGGAHFINNCFIWTKKKFHNNGEMKNYSFIKADDETVINGGAVTSLLNGAMIKTSNITINGTVTGSGNTSLIKVSNNTTINGGGSVSGPVQYCDQNGIETNWGSISNGAALGCSLYIPVTSCNTEGNGTAPVLDTDGDGIADAIDAYPNDAGKAFNNYYPSNASNSASTIAFEDLWPSKGDYDMNDIVITYRYNIVTNAKNQVVQVNATYVLVATGGTYQNGFGVEFPVNRADVASLSGATLETGQNKAVAVLFTNSKNEQSRFNTRPEEELAPTKTYNVTFTVNSKPLLSTFGLSSYNPFIWNNSKNRGYETHLPGKTPTTLAQTNLFGTGDDKTGSGKYYVTEKGLPWAVDIPQTPFVYPAEGKDVSKSYLHLADWAASGGNVYADWYSNTAQGYRNNTNLFLK